jgi:signal transduction histidine kinase
MLDEIYDSIDDGLDNQKGLIIQKAAADPTILKKNSFDEGDYAIVETNAELAKDARDLYIDTLMYMDNEKDFEPVRLLRTMFHSNGKYYQMEVVTSMVEEDDLIVELFYSLLWLYLGLVATIIILNNVLLKRIWRPFYHLLRQLKNFKLESQSNIQTAKTNIDEFRLLNETVQKLLQSNIAAYNSQKNFIENAAHELQTPLAISINKLEALAEKGRLSDEELRLLGSALDNLERLTRLNKSLLLLFKIENRQFAEEVPVNINDLINKICDDFLDQINYYGLTVEIQEPNTATRSINPDLANILFINLIKNAIVHNHQNGVINILITNKFVKIENTGQAEALDRQALFKRFNSNQAVAGSNGLGLSIVKAIADLYSFDISYNHEERHIFFVSFDR